MTKDITERLRAVFHNDRSVELMNREAADEIERLRNELDGAKLAYRGACYDRDRIKAERDEARRHACEVEADRYLLLHKVNGLGEAPYTPYESKDVALRMGWDCFKEKP